MQIIIKEIITFVLRFIQVKKFLKLAVEYSQSFVSVEICLLETFCLFENFFLFV